VSYFGDGAKQDILDRVRSVKEENDLSNMQVVNILAEVIQYFAEED
jgi:hypothetical protein